MLLSVLAKPLSDEQRAKLMSRVRWVRRFADLDGDGRPTEMFCCGCLGQIKFGAWLNAFQPPTRIAPDDNDKQNGELPRGSAGYVINRPIKSP
jgi:hypothetical protein